MTVKKNKNKLIQLTLKLSETSRNAKCEMRNAKCLNTQIQKASIEQALQPKGITVQFKMIPKGSDHKTRYN
jgi:hypothetical protein